MSVDGKEPFSLKRICIPWQFYLVIIVVSAFLFPGLLGYASYYYTGSNGIACDVVALSECAFVAIVLIAWWASSRRGKN